VKPDIACEFSGKSVLITGGAGFIGSALARRLAPHANVTIIDSLIPEYGGNLKNLQPVKDKINLNISDVRDSHSLPRLIRGSDVIFNMAGQTSHVDSMENPFIDLEINSRAQLSILEAVRHVGHAVKIVFASTRQLYGRPKYLPVDEAHPVRPVDVNGINKLAGEYYHLLYNDVYGIPTSVLRLTNTYGPGMRIKDARQTFVGIWIRQILTQKPFEVWGGDQLRDFNYVDDVVDALLIAALNDCANGKVYNLGSKEIVSLSELGNILCELTKGSDHPAKSVLKAFPEERKKIDIGDYYSDFSLISKELGWAPGVSLQEGLRITLDYYAKNLKDYM
jgi:UDP-glucose 4-epimerase